LRLLDTLSVRGLPGSIAADRHAAPPCNTRRYAHDLEFYRRTEVCTPAPCTLSRGWSPLCRRRVRPVIAL